ncbi:MAG: hypothetical protein ACTTKP_06070 [Catonella sp.]|uniref:hypothetical protein n=1 Tax=Catonella sp. TaxID=2382125 RepID=UPI003F9FB4FD
MKNVLFFMLSLFLIFANSIDATRLRTSLAKSAVERYEVKKVVSSLGNLEIDYGINGYLRTSSVIRVKVVLKNAKKDFEGSIHLRYYSVGDALSSYSEKIRLKQGEDAVICFYPFLNTVSPRFIIAILDEKGKEVEHFSSDIEEGKVDENSELVVASLLPKDNKISFFGEKTFRIKRIYLKEEQIEGDYRDLSLFDLIIKPDNAEKVLKTKTIAVLEERERNGGVTISEKDAVNFNLKRLYLGREDRLEWIWKAENVLIPVLEDLAIRTEKYVAIIIIYIIVACPVTYFILAKRKRKVQYWIFVPVWSLIFTAIIYMVSADSRIDGMYMKYVSVLDFRKDSHIENVSFSVTNSSNLPYKLEINNGYKVESLYGSYPQIGEQEGDKVKYNIASKVNGADINVMEATAFDTLFLRASGVPEISVKNTGRIYRNQNIVKGEFKNELGINLNKVFAVYDDEIIYIGDVAKGESRIFKAEAGKVFLDNFSVRLQDSVFLNKIFNFAYEGEDPKIQNLMTVVLEKISALRSNEPCFVALSSGRLRGEFASDAANIGGYTIMILPAEKKADIGTDSDNFINSIGKLPMMAGDGSYGFSTGAFLNRNSIDISYVLDKNKKPKKLMLLSLYKEEINPCKVYILNHLTGRYDFIFYPDDNFVRQIRDYVSTGGQDGFDRGKDQTFNINSVYVKDGKITLRYEIGQSPYDVISSFYIPNIPKISLEYEE